MRTLTDQEAKILNNSLTTELRRMGFGTLVDEAFTLLAATPGTASNSIAALLGTARNLDYLRLAELQLSDNEVLVFGTGVGVGGDISTKFDGSDLVTSVVGASEGWKIGAASHVLDITLHGSLTLGVDDTGYDLKVFGATASKYLWWDQAHDDLTILGSLTLTGAALLKGTVGMGTGGTTFTVAADGSLAVATDKFVVTAATGKTAITHTSAVVGLVEPFVLSSTLTGPGATGGRARFALGANVALGDYANALKAITTFGASGRIMGTASAFCAEMVLSAGTTQGTYAPLESELNMASGASLGTATSFLYGDVGGTGAGEILDGAYLLELGPHCTIDTGHVVQASAKSAINATHAIKIRVAATTLYIPAHTSVGFGIG